MEQERGVERERAIIVEYRVAVAVGEVRPPARPQHPTVGEPRELVQPVEEMWGIDRRAEPLGRGEDGGNDEQAQGGKDQEGQESAGGSAPRGACSPGASHVEDT